MQRCKGDAKVYWLCKDVRVMQRCKGDAKSDEKV